MKTYSSIILCALFFLGHAEGGQQAQRILAEVRHNAGVPLILLDEWDANLDSYNIDEISQLIDELSMVTCVVESRHFKGSRPRVEESVENCNKFLGNEIDRTVLR